MSGQKQSLLNVGTENVMCINDNSREFNSKPRFDKIVDQTMCYISLAVNKGNEKSLLWRLFPSILCMNTPFCAQVSFTHWSTSREGEITSFHSWGFLECFPSYKLNTQGGHFRVFFILE